MYTIKESIEIAAPPELVREKFLQFDQLTTYHKDGFFKSISTEVPGAPLEPGTKMKAVIELMAMTPDLLENSPTCFKWGGGASGIFAGEHAFHFEPSKLTKGGTTFYQEEKFTGLLAFTMGEGMMARWIGIPEKTRIGWTKYNQDLKAWCEK